MTSENKTWESVKTDYLHQVEKALSSVRHPRKGEVLEDVRSHLDSRFAELQINERTWENFQAIIAEMGPASDYAELLEPDTARLSRSTRRTYLLWFGLAILIIIAAAILLPMIISPEVAHIIAFEPLAPFEPRTAGELLGAFNENLPANVRTHHFRTRIRDNKLQGLICVDTKAGTNAIISMIDNNKKLVVISVRGVTQKDLERHYAMGQPSLPKSTPSQGMSRALLESPNRKLLDEQTQAQLRRHEQFSAEWFKVEEAYEAASASDKNKMIKQWIADANGSDFDKMTRAIAALGNVAAEEAVDVLINIGQKPKGGNRPRWMAVRALGRIGDTKAVPLLINLLDHYNSDTRFYAKVALAEITGVYFDDSKEKWLNWAQQQGIEVKQMDVGKKSASSARNSASRTRPPQTPDKTVSRTGELPDEVEAELERLNRPEARNERKLLQELQEAQEQWLKNKSPDALKKCESLIEQIIKQSKPSAQAYFTTAMAADLLERPKQAILILKKAVVECPDERAGGLAVPVKISGYFRIGAIARQLGDAEEATKAYDSAIKNSQGVKAEEFCKACCFMYLAEIASEILKDEQLALKRLQKAIAVIDTADLNKLSRDWAEVYPVLKDWASYEYEKLKYKKTPVIDNSKDVKLKHEGVFGLTVMSTSLNGLEHPLLLKKVADSEKSPIDGIFAKFALAIFYSHELNLSPSEAEKYLSILAKSDSYFAPYAKMMLQMVQQ